MSLIPDYANAVGSAMSYNRKVTIRASGIEELSKRSAVISRRSG